MTVDQLTEHVARALHEAHKPWCDYTYDFEDPMASREVYETLARAAIATVQKEGTNSISELFYPPPTGKERDAACRV